MRLIDGSDCDYITPSGVVYKYYYDGMYFKKKNIINNHNKYVYCNITFSDGVNRARRVHVLLAKAYIRNFDTEHLKLVGHKDDNKQNNELSNLYWTDNRENTQSAVNHGLNDQPKAEQNDNSILVKVIDKNNGNIVGVYGSIRECARCIKNNSVSYIAKMISASYTRTRTKKYLYQMATKAEFNDNLRLRSVKLEENPVANKNPKVFYLINKSTGYKQIFDNQVQASKVCGIKQATISHMIKNGTIIDGWECSLIKEINYKDATSYQNFMETIDEIIIQNINTNEIKTYNSGEILKAEFGLNGHDIRQYLYTGHILMNEWKVIAIDDKSERREYEQQYNKTG